jgi:hypothetical protein
MYGIKYSSNSKDFPVRRLRNKFNPEILGHYVKQPLSVMFCIGLIDTVDSLKDDDINFRRLSTTWIDKCNRKKHLTVAEGVHAVVWTSPTTL